MSGRTCVVFKLCYIAFKNIFKEYCVILNIVIIIIILIFIIYYYYFYSKCSLKKVFVFSFQFIFVHKSTTILVYAKKNMYNRGNSLIPAFFANKFPSFFISNTNYQYIIQASRENYILCVFFFYSNTIDAIWLVISEY